MKKLTTIIVLIAGILIVSICNFNTVREAFELNTRKKKLRIIISVS